MRYKLNEDVTLIGSLPSSSTVTVRLVNMDNDTLVALTTDVCVESVVVPGVYRWNTSNISTPLEGYINCYYEMTDGINIVSGKLVYGGYVDTLGNPLENAAAVWGHELG